MRRLGAGTRPTLSHRGDPPLRVANVIVGLGAGGAETMLARVVGGLDRSAFSPFVVSLTQDGPIGDSLRERAVPIHCLDMRPGRPTPSVVLRLRRLLLDQEADVVQTWMYHADLIGGLAARLARLPAVWGVQVAQWPAASVSTRVVRWTCARTSTLLAREVICCAESARAVHAAYGYRAPLTVVHNAPDPVLFVGDAEVGALVRRELGIPANAKVVGMMARADPQKDHRTLARAVARIAPEFPGLHVVLAGNGVVHENWQLVQDLGPAAERATFHLLGARRDVHRVLAALDEFVLASIAEGLPLAVTEAMAAGVPCVVSDVGDCRRVVGDTGWIVPVGDDERMAESLIGALLLTPEERRATGAAASGRVREHFSLERAVDGYTEAWERAMTGLDLPRAPMSWQ